MNNKWNAKTNPGRFVIMLVIVTAVCLMVGMFVALVVNRAEAVPTPTSASYGCIMDNGTACPTVTKKNKRSARKFRHHKIHHADGFAPAQVFTHPKVARRVIVRKIVRALKHSKSAKVPANDAGCSDYCQAWKMYGQMVEDADCVDQGRPYPLTNGTCVPPDNTHEFTKAQIQAGGAVILCGGAVAFGVATSGATAGTTAFVAVWGATACGWSFWSALDPG